MTTDNSTQNTDLLYALAALVVFCVLSYNFLPLDGETKEVDTEEEVVEEKTTEQKISNSSSTSEDEDGTKQ